MRILDNNSINYIFANNVTVNGVYFIPPDIKDESEIAELIFGKKISPNIKEFSKETVFNEALYFSKYKEMLNKHAGRSFYNMTGFGDISILALIATLKEFYGTKAPAQLPGMQEELFIYTEDQGLKNKIIEEFFPQNEGDLIIQILNNTEIS